MIPSTPTYSKDPQARYWQDFYFLFKMGYKIINVVFGWLGVGRKRGGGEEKKRGPDQIWEETGEMFRGSGN